MSWKLASKTQAKTHTHTCSTHTSTQHLWIILSFSVSLNQHNIQGSTSYYTRKSYTCNNIMEKCVMQFKLKHYKRILLYSKIHEHFVHTLRQTETENYLQLDNNSFLTILPFFSPSRCFNAHSMRMRLKTVTKYGSIVWMELFQCWL